MRIKIMRYRFQKMVISLKLLGIFEFCKKQHIKNFTRNLIAKFKIKNSITEFFKKIFSFFTKAKVIFGVLGAWMSKFGPCLQVPENDHDLEMTLAFVKIANIFLKNQLLSF